jgi:hypothetical protein
VCIPLDALCTCESMTTTKLKFVVTVTFILLCGCVCMSNVIADNFYQGHQLMITTTHITNQNTVLVIMFTMIASESNE